MVDSLLLAVGENGGGDLALIATTFAFGLRHGIDWDHLAAIADITGSTVGARKSMYFATLYAAGHAVVVLLLGVVAIEAGLRLPKGVDAVMERFVGLTLLVFGLYVVYAVVRQGRAFRMRSRWMLFFSAARRVLTDVRTRRRGSGSPIVIEHDHGHDHASDRGHAHDHPTPGDRPAAVSRARTATLRRGHRHVHRHEASMPPDPFARYGAGTCVAVGMLHGVGAETPTQVLIFVTAAGVAGRATGAALLLVFLLGLLVSNTLIAVASTFGFMRAEVNFRIYVGVAAIVAALSVIVGALLLSGRAAVLPPLLG